MNVLRIILAGLALMSCVIGAFRMQYSEGPRVDWTALGLTFLTLAYLLSLLEPA